MDFTFIKGVRPSGRIAADYNVTERTDGGSERNTPRLEDVRREFTPCGRGRPLMKGLVYEYSSRELDQS